MARILCNVAGGGKPLKGNAEAGDVLAGKTFSNKKSNALTGTMPNNGAWSSSTSGSGTVIIPAGYHNGSGGVDCSGAYNAGVSAADARVNTSSASYNSGYTNGINSVNIDFFCAWAGSSTNGWDCNGNSLWNTQLKRNNAGNFISNFTRGWGGGNNRTITVKANCTMVSNKGTWNLNAGQSVTQGLTGADNNSAGDWSGYVYAR